MIAWILFALSAIAVLIIYAKQGELRRQLADAEAKVARLDAGTSDQKVPVAAAAGAGQVALVRTEALGDLEKRLHASHAEVKRLEAAVADAEKRLVTERTKSEAAVAKASVAEAMVSQTRSRATEAGHSALMEARKEADDVRALLVDAQMRLQTMSVPERRTEELVSAARAEAEKRAHDQYESRLQEANAEFERNVTMRLATERERHEAEQHHLLLELEKARVALQTQERMALPPSVPEPTMLPRTRPVITKGTEIGGSGDEKPLVIVADSDANSVKNIAQHLEAGGYSVRSTSSVAEAILAARSSAPVAFALDSTNLPDGDCWSVLASVKEDPDLREIPVLIFAPNKDKERAMEMGAAGCFPKPIDKAVLIATIKAAMVKRKQRARLAAASGGASVARRTSALTTP